MGTWTVQILYYMVRSSLKSITDMAEFALHHVNILAVTVSITLRLLARYKNYTATYTLKTYWKYFVTEGVPYSKPNWVLLL